jgi:hypothetical protein
MLSQCTITETATPEIMNTFNKLQNKWTLYAHLPHNTDWSLSSYMKISTVEYLEDTIAVTETLPNILIENCMLFMMKENIKPTMIVLEMHNNDNEVKAISLVKNTLITDKTYRIYKDGNYNRYIYKSRYRLVIKDVEASMTSYEKKIITIFNRLLFKGAHHFKRQQGITAVPDWIMQNKYIDFIKYFKEMFARFYQKGAQPASIASPSTPI